MVESLHKIKSFIERERGKYDFPLEVETRIEKDLGITGDDAVEFLVAFGKEFDVDVSNFMAGDYFEGEGDGSLDAILDLFRKTPRDRKPYKVLKIKHLQKALDFGKLDEETINSTP